MKIKDSKTKDAPPKSRRHRALEPHEHELWKVVTRHVSPLRRRKPVKAVETVEALASEPLTSSKTASPAPHHVAAAKTTPAAKAQPLKPQPAQPSVARPTVPPLAPVERRVKQRLARGQIEVDGRIDLHGMRQATAHAKLIGFLRRSQADGARVVIVVTGKGTTTRTGEDGFQESGVLRRAVPVWLSEADVRSLVIGFEEAAPHHGGGGALYVRLRRARFEAGTR